MEKGQPINYEYATGCGDQEGVSESRRANYSHVECVLHYYGIPATEVMTVVGDVSRAGRYSCSNHRWVEHRQRAARRLCVSPTLFDSVLRPLGVYISIPGKCIRSAITWTYRIAVREGSARQAESTKLAYVPLRKICLIFARIRIYRERSDSNIRTRSSITFET